MTVRQWKDLRSTTYSNIRRLMIERAMKACIENGLCFSIEAVSRWVGHLDRVRCYSRPHHRSNGKITGRGGLAKEECSGSSSRSKDDGGTERKGIATAGHVPASPSMINLFRENRGTLVVLERSVIAPSLCHIFRTRLSRQHTVLESPFCSRTSVLSLVYRLLTAVVLLQPPLHAAVTLGPITMRRSRCTYVKACSMRFQ